MTSLAAGGHGVLLLDLLHRVGPVGVAWPVLHPAVVTLEGPNLLARAVPRRDVQSW